MGKELSEMPEVTFEDYKRVDRQLERKRARRGFTIHAIVYAVVLTGLIILSVTLGNVFPWAALPMAWWGGRPDPALPVWGALGRQDHSRPAGPARTAGRGRPAVRLTPGELRDGTDGAGRG
jgi:hypothetical protein